MRVKKMYRTLLCLLLCASLLFGCNKTQEEPEDKKDPQTQTQATGTPTQKPQNTPTPEVDLNTTEALEEQEAFDAFLTQIFLDILSTQNSVTLHFMMQHPEEYGLTQEFTFGDIEMDAQEYASQCEAYQEEMEKFSYELLTQSQKINYDRLAYEFRLAISAADLTRCYSSLFSQNGNVISNSSTYYTEYAICEEKDAEDFLKFLEMYPELLGKVLLQAEKDQEEGLLPTKSMLETTLETVEGMLSTSEHPFVAAYSENLWELEGLSEESHDAYVERAQTIVNETVVPALQDFAEEIRTAISQEQYASPQGMCFKDGGKEYYTYMAQSALGSEMTVEEMLAYLQEKAKSMVQSYMMMLMFDSDVIDRYEQASYPMSDPEAILNQLKEKIKDSFPAIGETNFTVSYLPEVLENDGVMAYYLMPQIDNFSRKIIRVNASAVGEDTITLYSTLAHEGYPGHLYQNEYFCSTEGYHEINALFTYLGYAEGWASVVGAMAYDWCCDDKNVASCYRFDTEFSMLLAAWADIGVNYYGWDTDDVYEMLSENYIDSYEAAELFYEMSVSDPCVYLPYTLGYYLTEDTIEELKDSGMSEMEALEAFLNVGPCTFEVLHKHLGLE